MTWILMVVGSTAVASLPTSSSRVLPGGGGDQPYPTLSDLSETASYSIHSSERAIYAGEMPEPNAHTLPRGSGQFDALTKLSFGIAHDLQINSNLARLGLIGPNGSLEWALLQNRRNALSVTASIQQNWDEYSKSFSVLPMYTIGGHQGPRLSIGYGLERKETDWASVPKDDRLYTVALLKDNEVEVKEARPLHAVLDLQLRKSDVIQIWWQSDALLYSDGEFSRYRAGLSWTHGGDYLRGSLGATVNYNALSGAQEILDVIPDGLPLADVELPVFLPLPYVRIWWRF